MTGNDCRTITIGCVLPQSRSYCFLAASLRENSTVDRLRATRIAYALSLRIKSRTDSIDIISRKIMFSLRHAEQMWRICVYVERVCI